VKRISIITDNQVTVSLALVGRKFSVCLHAKVHVYIMLRASRADPVLAGKVGGIRLGRNRAGRNKKTMRTVA
jgi:hypothetical protein